MTRTDTDDLLKDTCIYVPTQTGWVSRLVFTYLTNRDPRRGRLHDLNRPIMGPNKWGGYPEETPYRKCQGVFRGRFDSESTDVVVE